MLAGLLNKIQCCPEKKVNDSMNSVTLWRNIIMCSNPHLHWVRNFRKLRSNTGLHIYYHIWTGFAILANTRCNICAKVAHTASLAMLRSQIIVRCGRQNAKNNCMRTQYLPRCTVTVMIYLLFLQKNWQTEQCKLKVEGDGSCDRQSAYG